MQISRRAHYNVLRMNREKSAAPWEVEDYRELSLETLFARLRDFQIALDRPTFISLSDEEETPEEFADNLSDSVHLDPANREQVYLLIFELWRRIVPEKLCLSIFCDELDRQIELYDANPAANEENLQDAIANLIVILDENTDNGVTPHEVFESIKMGCAHDLEDFFYDFIAFQFDNNQISYAEELLDDINPYITSKWFELLKARLVAATNPSRGNRLIFQLVQDHLENPSIEFILESLSALTPDGEPDFFRKIVKQAIPLIQKEEEFQDLLNLCADYFHYSDQDDKENLIQDILSQRTQIPANQSLEKSDSHILTLTNLLQPTS